MRSERVLAVPQAHVPFNQYSIPGEATTTGADGRPNLGDDTASGVPAAKQQHLLIVFARP